MPTMSRRSVGLVPSERTDFRITPEWEPIDADTRESFEDARMRWQMTGGNG